MRSAWNSALLSGKSMIVIDNANGELGGDKLAIAVDQPLISVRPLGASKTVEIENRASLFATGVNCTVRGDLVRRTITISLEPQEERPEARVFARDPLQDILANRGKYIAAVLTVARAYLAAGEPSVACERVASFGAWSRFVQRPLVWLGYDDVAGAMRTGEALDSERAAIAEIMAAWPSDPLGTGFTVHELVSRANSAKAPDVGADADAPVELQLLSQTSIVRRCWKSRQNHQSSSSQQMASSPCGPHRRWVEDCLRGEGFETEITMLARRIRFLSRAPEGRLERKVKTVGGGGSGGSGGCSS